jgi:hypothetical protein
MDGEKLKMLTEKYIPIVMAEHINQLGSTLFTDMQILEIVNVDSDDKSLHRVEYIIGSHRYTAFIDPVTNRVIGK